MKSIARPDDPASHSALTLAGSEIHLPNLGRAVWRARRWVIVTPIVVVLLAGLWCWLQEPEFEARATLLVENERPSSGVLMQQVAAFAGLTGQVGSLETDLRLLESRQVAEGVVDSLALQVKMLEPRRPRSEVFSEVRAEREAFVGRVRFTLQSGNHYSIEIELPENAPRTGFPIPEQVAVGESFEIGGVLLQLRDFEGEEVPEEIELQVVDFRSAVDGLLDRLEVGAVGGSSVVEVAVRDTDPILAASSSNALVARFIDYRLHTSRSEARGAIDFLKEQVAQYEKQLRDAEERLRQYREQEGVVALNEAASQQAQRLATLDARRAELIAERDVLAQLINEVSASAASTGGTAAYRKLAAFPEFFRNPAVQNILTSLVQLENRRADLIVQRTTANRDVVGITERIQDLEEQLYRTATNYLASLEEQISAVERTIERSVGQASRVPEVQTEFMRLSREVELLDEIYTLLQMRLKEQEVTEADFRSDVRPLDAALVPLAPVAPRTRLILLLALIVGTMMGLGLAFGRAVLDPAMYSKEVAVAAAGGVPILTSIPEHRTPGSLPIPVRLGALRKVSERQVPSGNGAGPLGVVDPGTLEAYADLRTRLAVLTNPAPRVLVVTSPRQGDGKTTVAVNLARAYARNGVRTLLLEGDLRRADLGKQMGLGRERLGLGQVLHGSADVADAIQTVELAEGPSASLDVLLAGDSPRHPSELLEAAALSRLLDELRGRYEMIVIDTPPLRAVADALLLARLSDGALLVTRSGATDRDALEEAITDLDAVGVRVYGLVLNGFSGSRTMYSYGA